MKRNLTFTSWNVNGIRAWHRKGGQDWFLKHSPDFFCVQETKAHPDQLVDELKDPEGYFSYFDSSRARKGYSGVAIFTKHAPLSFSTGLDVEHLDKEGRLVQLEYESFFLIACYFPNGKKNKERLDFKMEYYKAFLDHIRHLEADKPVVFCGDVNTAHEAIDLARPEANEKVSGFLREERDWIDEVIADGYSDTFRQLHPEEASRYSWWDMKTRARDRNVGWRIDYFFISKELQESLKKASILDEVEGSDHCPVEIKIEMEI